jgi:hypothetical protein
MFDIPMLCSPRRNRFSRHHEGVARQARVRTGAKESDEGVGGQKSDEGVGGQKSNEEVGGQKSVSSGFKSRTGSAT